MMCKCFQCEMLIDDDPIKVVDFPASSPFDQELFHFEEGYRCQFNGRESLVVEDLQSGRCRSSGIIHRSDVRNKWCRYANQ